MRTLLILLLSLIAHTMAIHAQDTDYNFVIASQNMTSLTTLNYNPPQLSIYTRPFGGTDKMMLLSKQISKVYLADDGWIMFVDTKGINIAAVRANANGSDARFEFIDNKGNNPLVVSHNDTHEPFAQTFAALKKAVASGTATKPRSTAAKTSAAAPANHASAKIVKTSVKKGLTVNGFPSIQIDVESLIKNAKGKKYYYELRFEANGKNIINDGDAADSNGKYFKSIAFAIPSGDYTLPCWWKVYLKRLNIPQNCKQIKAYITLKTETGQYAAGTPAITINLNNNQPDTYTY